MKLKVKEDKDSQSLRLTTAVNAVTVEPLSSSLTLYRLNFDTIPYLNVIFYDEVRFVL